MKTTVIHHSADFDGIFCREIARKFLPDAELIGWDFKDEPLPIPNGQIYILDLPVDRVFGFDFTKPMSTDASVHQRGALTYAALHNSVIWIDHHKSSIKSHPRDFPGYRIDGVAACRLAWQWFTKSLEPKWNGENGDRLKNPNLPTDVQFKNREVAEPLAVRLAGEYDIWDKSDPDAELFQHGLRSRELGPDTWDILLSGPTPPEGDKQGLAELYVDTLLNAGEALQYARTHENASIIKELGFTFQWEGLTWLACNHARYNSHLFTAALRLEHDACFGFKFTGHVAAGKPSEEWSVSLYHAPGKEHHDLSLIAVKHGGGGHRGACGFRTDRLPFMS